MAELPKTKKGRSKAPDISEKEAAFHIQEYNTLRDEITRWSLDIRFYERSGVIGPSAIYSWLYINQGAVARPSALLVLWFAPIVMSLFFWYRTRVIKRFIMVIAEYIKTIEVVSRYPGLSGWEHFLTELRGKQDRSWSLLVITEDGFWIILIAVYSSIVAWRFLVA